MQWIQDMAEQLPIKEDSRIEDVQVSVSPETARQYWLKRNRSSNFLKHADRDTHDHISIDEINNLELLMLALNSYSDLVKDDLGAEGLILWLYFCATHGTKEHLPEQFLEMATKLEKLNSEDQLEFCLVAIQELNASDT